MIIYSIISAYNRCEFLNKSLQALVNACEKFDAEHLIIVTIDDAKSEMIDVVSNIMKKTSIKIALIANGYRLGLPYTHNLLFDVVENIRERTDKTPDYICYLQDDCVIKYPQDFFKVMIDSLLSIPAEQRGYVSGYYTPIHPGFEKHKNKYTIVYSDSITGVNMMAEWKVWRSIGKLTPFLSDGSRRGNPGPNKGSNFDIWQWKESPNSLTKQKRISIIIPGLCSYISKGRQDSSWRSREGENGYYEERIRQGRIYNTRGSYPKIEFCDLYNVLEKENESA